MDSAVTDLPYPAETENQVYWYIALAGNLLWAGTCFLNPAVAGEATLIKVMSFAGATYGSGTLQRADGTIVPPAPTDPNGAREHLRKQVAKARGQLETYFQKQRFDWAAGFSKLQDWNNADGTVIDLFNVYVWEKMFPWIPYNDDRFNKIRSEALRVVRAAMADYNRQWQQFKRATVWSGKAELKKHNIVFHPEIRIFFGAKSL